MGLLVLVWGAAIATALLVGGRLGALLGIVVLIGGMFGLLYTAKWNIKRAAARRERNTT